VKRHQDSLKKTMVVDMVEEIQRNYSPRELEGANNARRLYVIMGGQSEETFKLTLKKGLVLNNPVTC
jgi:pyruvate/2-oxoacid:ferredoxin oxidoreductase alpha subunit